MGNAFWWTLSRGFSLGVRSIWIEKELFKKGSNLTHAFCVIMEFNLDGISTRARPFIFWRLKGSYIWENIEAFYIQDRRRRRHTQTKLNLYDHSRVTREVCLAAVIGSHTREATHLPLFVRAYAYVLTYKFITHAVSASAWRFSI